MRVNGRAVEARPTHCAHLCSWIQQIQQIPSTITKLADIGSMCSYLERIQRSKAGKSSVGFSFYTDVFSFASQHLGFPATFAKHAITRASSEWSFAGAQFIEIY